MIFWQYFDIVICALYRHFLRSLSSFAQKVSKCYRDKYLQLKLHKHIWTYDKKLSKSHDPQKRSQAIILGGRVGCVSWLPLCWCKIFRINEIYFIPFSNLTVLCVSMSKNKSMFFEHTSIFPHDLQQAWCVLTAWTVMSPNPSASIFICAGDITMLFMNFPCRLLVSKKSALRAGSLRIKVSITTCWNYPMFTS